QNHQYDIAAGLRRKNEQGGRFEISQKLGHQNTNSTFFVPNNQGTARLALSYTHPLLRGSGEEYNRSLVVLAQIDTAAATDEFHRELQTHLLEVTRAYWGLHLERATLVQKYRLYAESTRILADLVGRAEIDANQTQIANARAAVATRRADLIRALTAVKNAESRIRGLVNAPELGDGDSVELIPLDTPTHDFLPTNLSHSMGTALQSRPEINLALREIQAACLRTHVSWNELLPVLNLVTEAYISGLQGQSDIPQAIGNQYSVGRPSYTIGIQYEVPLGNRAASARHTRRHLELRQMQSRYRSTTESIKVEVEVAVREVETAYGEMLAKYEQMLAANAEVDSIESRWKHLPGMDGNAGLILDQLLRAQERLTAAETGFSLAELTYNLSLMNLKKAEGTLIQQESISEGRIQDGDLPRTILDKPTGMVPSSFSRPQEPTLAYP
ncbi:MAG: TolC family protein, partial [Planctomycetaceae bacterium]